MMERVLVVLVVGCLITAAHADDSKDLERMRGTWAPTHAMRDGKEDRSNLRIEIDGPKLVIKDNGRVMAESTFSLDPATKPASIDLKLQTVSGAPTAKGIYEIRGDTLRLCWARGGGARPTEFTSKAETRTVLFELKRQKE